MFSYSVSMLPKPQAAQFQLRSYTNPSKAASTDPKPPTLHKKPLDIKTAQASKIINGFKFKKITFNPTSRSQRMPSEDECKIYKEYLLRRKNDLKTQLLVLNWAKKVPSITFTSEYLSLRKFIDRQLGKTLNDKTLCYLFSIIDRINKISPYLPQDLLLLAMELGRMLPSRRPFVKSLLFNFSKNVNNYLQNNTVGRDGRQVFVPHHFIEDVAKGMNVKLLERLVETKQVQVLSGFLSVFEIPPTVGRDIITKLIAIDPKLITSRMAAHYTPEQATMAMSELIKLKDAKVLLELVQNMPTRHYQFERSDLDQMIRIFDEHKMSKIFPRILSLISPRDFANPATLSIVSNYFLENSQFANLQTILEQHKFNVDWIQDDSKLEQLLNQLFDSKNRDFAFNILLNLGTDRINRIKEPVLEKWILKSNVKGKELDHLMKCMGEIAIKFDIIFPIPENIRTAETNIKQTTSDSKEQTQNLDKSATIIDIQQAPVSTSHTRIRGTDRFSLKSSLESTDTSSQAPQSEGAVPEPVVEKQILLLALDSRPYPVNAAKASWSTEQTMEYINLVKSFTHYFPDELPMKHWSAYILCLISLSSDPNYRSELDILSRSFENQFLLKKPVLNDEDVRLTTKALSALCKLLWQEARYSSSMSIANIMGYYKLRGDKDMDFIVRQQANMKSIVDGTPPMRLFSSILLSEQDFDPSFFNSFLSFLYSSMNFDINSAIVNGVPDEHKKSVTEAWNTIQTVWSKASKTTGWVPSSDLVSQVLRLAQLNQVGPAFLIEVIEFCQLHSVPVFPADLPLLVVLEELMVTSNITIGSYLLSNQGLNMLPALPSTTSLRKSMTHFIMKCLAHSSDHKNATLAFQLYSSDHVFNNQAQKLIESYFSVCKEKKNFVEAEKFWRSILPSQPYDDSLYTTIIELAGQCGELSSALRIYNEALGFSEASIARLSVSVLDAVAAAHVLPLEAQKVKTKISDPEIDPSVLRQLTSDFISNISTRETRRSKSAYVSL